MWVLFLDFIGCLVLFGFVGLGDFVVLCGVNTFTGVDFLVLML